MNRSILFFFLILFTAPLSAEDVFSENLDDERRRSGLNSVVVKLAYSSGMVAPGKVADETETVQSGPNSKTTPCFIDQFKNHLQTASPDQQPWQAFCYQHIGSKYIQTELDRRSVDNACKGKQTLHTGHKEWIGTVISETGPPSFPENSTSYPGHDNNGRLPQVASIKTPDIVSENVFYRIDRKTASVRTPTGPPDTLTFNCTARNRQPGPIPSPSFAFLDSSTCTQTLSRSMQAILRGAPMRLST